jgi:hypothetical protein
MLLDVSWIYWAQLMYPSSFRGGQGAVKRRIYVSHQRCRRAMCGDRGAKKAGVSIFAGLVVGCGTCELDLVSMAMLASVSAWMPERGGTSDGCRAGPLVDGLEHRVP